MNVYDTPSGMHGRTKNVKSYAKMQTQQPMFSLQTHRLHDCPKVYEANEFDWLA
jgi:hypothetical protein